CSAPRLLRTLHSFPTRRSSDLLAAEAERRYADQVGGIADLAGRVARQGELRVPAAHPFAVVAHPNQGLAAVLDLDADRPGTRVRSEEHTSELQSRFDLVCRLLL